MACRASSTASSTRMLAAVTGPGGRLVIGHDEQGRAIVTNFPATLPTCSAPSARSTPTVEAVVAGDERLTFAELDRIVRPRSPTALAGARDRARATASASRCATARPGSSPTWRSLKAGAVATLLNGWWQADEMQHALDLTEPEADHRRRAAREADRRRAAPIARSSTLPIDEPVERGAGRRLLDGARRGSAAARSRARRRRDHPVHLGLDRRGQGRAFDPPRGDHRRLCLCHRADRPARHPDRGGPRRRPTRRGPWSACPCSTSPARCR